MSYEIYKVFEYINMPRKIADKLIELEAHNGSYSLYTVDKNESDVNDYFLKEGITLGETILILISW